MKNSSSRYESRASVAGWRSHQRGILLGFFAEHKRALLRVPVDIRSAQRGRPLQLEVSGESGFDFQRLLGFDVEQNDGPRFVHRNAERLANAKRIADIQDRCGLRTDRQGSSQTLRGQGAIADKKSQMKVAKDFQRIHPGFEPVRSRCRTVPRACQRPARNSQVRMVRDSSSVWSRLLGCGRETATAARSPTRNSSARWRQEAQNAEHESDKNSLRPSHETGIWHRRLAKSRFPEYKE